MGEAIDGALDLMRRLPPQDTQKNLASLCHLAPNLTEELLQTVDQPLAVAKCKSTGKEYLLCDYNRDGDSYRSPWSNLYNPACKDAIFPSDRLRKFEISANDAFDTYRELYYEGGVSSVYAWDLDEGFASVVLLKKDTEGGKNIKGSWDSIHVVEIQERGKNATYKLTSTIFLYLLTNGADSGEFNLAGSLTRQAAQDMSVEDPVVGHVSNLGKIIEDMELRLRNSLQEIYFGKTGDIVSELRSLKELEEVKKQRLIHKQLLSNFEDRK